MEKKVKIHSKQLTIIQKTVILHLLTDGYLILCRNFKGARKFKLFTGKQNPVRWLTDKQMDYRIKNLLKENKKGIYTLNLNTVRSLDGRSWVKKQYKRISNNKH